MCHLCLRAPETILHCIWECPAAVAVWQECKRPLQKLSHERTDGRGLFMYFLEKLDQVNLLEALMMARMIWIRPNSVVLGEGFSPPSQIMGAVKLSLEEFLHSVTSSTGSPTDPVGDPPG